MSFTSRTRYLLVTLAVLTACLIQYARGYRPLILVICAVTFLIAGNLVVYLAGARERAARRRLQRDYYAGTR